MGMLVMGVAFVSGLAIGAAVVVAVTAVASITLLPALLGYAGSRVELTRWRGLIAAGLVAVALIGVAFSVPALTLPCLALAAVVLIAGIFFAPLKKEVPKRAPKPLRQTTAYRWSRIIQHHPWPAAIAGTVILVVLALPFLGLRMGFSDEGNYPEDTTTRKAYDLIAEGFGPGFNGPLILATEIPPGTDPATLDAVSQSIAETEGVAFASPAQVNEAGTAARVVRRARRPRHRTRPPPTSSTTSATTSSPPRPTAPGSTWPSPATWPSTSTSPSTSAPACPTSSPSCSACRSCS